MDLSVKWMTVTVLGTVATLALAMCVTPVDPGACQAAYHVQINMTDANAALVCGATKE